MISTAHAGDLDVAYEEHGDPRGEPVFLLHGFPYDVRAFDDVAPLVADTGARVIVPYLRGFGPTRFASGLTPRSGQQAALGADVLALMDALHVERAVVAGFDWGGRAACVVSALHPERVRGMVTVNGYNVSEIARAGEPASPRTSAGIGTSITFTANVGGPGSPQTAATSADTYGRSGRRHGRSRMRRSYARRPRSTTRISSTW